MFSYIMDGVVAVECSWIFSDCFANILSAQVAFPNMFETAQAVTFRYPDHDHVSRDLWMVESI